MNVFFSQHNESNNQPNADLYHCYFWQPLFSFFYPSSTLTMSVDFIILPGLERF